MFLPPIFLVALGSTNWLAFALIRQHLLLGACWPAYKVDFHARGGAATMGTGLFVPYEQDPQIRSAGQGRRHAVGDLR
jgi:hypothetical protein